MSVLLCFANTNIQNSIKSLKFHHMVTVLTVDTFIHLLLKHLNSQAFCKLEFSMFFVQI